MSKFFTAFFLVACVALSAQAAPVVTISWPSSNSTTSNSSIAVSGNVSSTSVITSVRVNNVEATLNSVGVLSTTWTATVPLGYGTNALTATATDATGNYTTTTTTPVLVTCTSNSTYSLTANSSATGVITTNASNTAPNYNPLIIPDTISATTMNLTLAATSKRFFSAGGANATATLGYNGMPFWGPTLIMYKGDKMQMNVKNNLSADSTTCHWHGLHVPAIMDGGPHIKISANTTWTPSFIITNDASTCWYHPHYHGNTATQVAAGGGGFIIVRDGTEATKGLPWTYGVDDIPLAISSRTFNATTGQMMLANGTDSFACAVGNTMIVNGVIKPQVTLPKQIVRLRILNCELQRGLNLGLSDNSTFYVIGNDVGLLNAPAPVTRVQLTAGERVEVLLNLQNATVGSNFTLMAYNQTTASASAPTLPDSFLVGAAKGGSAFTTLTSSNFPILSIKIGNQTTTPICTPVTGNFSGNGSLTLSGASTPLVLANHTFYTTSNVTNNRTVELTKSSGFGFNGFTFNENYYNYSIPLNSIEKWTITNNSNESHPIHLHETKFNIIARKNLAGTANGTAVTTNGLPAAWETGWKDTVYVPRNEQVQIIVKFDQYASNTDPYMFHCHMITHEEENFMGQFLVVNNEAESLTVASFTSNATTSAKQIEFDCTTNTTYKIQYRADLVDSWSDIGTVTSGSGNSTTTYTDSDATRCANAQGFYRVVLPRIDTYPIISR